MLAPASAAVRIVATTPDLAAIAALVGGHLVSVESLVPPAVDAEAFEPKPADAETLRRADLVVRVGLGYDYWLDRLLAQIGDARLMRGGSGYVDASLGIPLLEVRGQSVVNEGGHSHGTANPHYWLDPHNAAIVGDNVAEALMRIAPGERERIVAARDEFATALAARLSAWSTLSAPFAGAKLLAYHNSWPYFARRFRLDIVDFIEPKPGVAASPAHLAGLVGKARGAGVRAIIHEPYEPEDASRYLAQRLGIPVVVLAASVGGLPRAKGYFETIEADLAALAQALAPP